MAALAAAAASVTPDALKEMTQRFPEEDPRKLFAFLTSKKGNVEEAVAVYEVNSEDTVLWPTPLRSKLQARPCGHTHHDNTTTGIPRLAGGSGAGLY